MDLDRLYQILSETTVELRKGEVFEGTPELVKQARTGEKSTSGGVLHVFMMPHEEEATSNLEKVDLHFLIVGVDKERAHSCRDEVMELLADYPDQESLAGGPSYITVGADLGSQSAALQLFALGKVLGLWAIITPEAMGATGDVADEMAGTGFIMTTGYCPPIPAGA